MKSNFSDIAEKVIGSNITTSNYIAAVKSDLGNQAFYNQQQVIIGAGKIKQQIEAIGMDLLKLSDDPSPKTMLLKLQAGELCNSLAKYYLDQAKNNACAYPQVRQEWTDLGNKYLKYTVDDHMREWGMLPPLKQEEDPVIMKQKDDKIEQLKADLAKVHEERLAQNTTITDLTQKLTVSEEKNAAQSITITDLTQQLQHQKEVNVEVTEQLQHQKEVNAELSDKCNTLSHENNELKEINLMSNNKLANSELEVAKLQEKVITLDHDNVEKDIEINALKQVHCNDPGHSNLLQDSHNLINANVGLSGDINLNEDLD